MRYKDGSSCCVFLCLANYIHVCMYVCCVCVCVCVYEALILRQDGCSCNKGSSYCAFPRFSGEDIGDETRNFIFWMAATGLVNFLLSYSIWANYGSPRYWCCVRASVCAVCVCVCVCARTHTHTHSARTHTHTHTHLYECIFTCAACVRAILRIFL
jgi:hypothetical protein